MKVLVISRVAWNINTNFGNTYTALFSGLEDVTVGHLCCGGGTPDNDIVSFCYQVTENDIVQSLYKRGRVCGKLIEPHGTKKAHKASLQRKAPKFTLLYIMRDLIWATNKWLTDDLKAFLDDFSPDIIFAPLYRNVYMNKIDKYIADYCEVPLVSFVSDDVYSFKQFRFSPMFWIYKLFVRKNIRKTVKTAKKLFTISDMQRKEYSKSFGKECSLLYKSANFYEKPQNPIPESPIKIVYTGNLSSGRWRTIAALAQAIKKCNNGKKLFELEIYSLTPLTDKMKNALNVDNASKFNGAIDGEKVKETQQNADILLHCESFNPKDKYEVRLSFSTKIVDYFQIGKCIMAIGPEDIASMKYLKDKDAAVIINNTKEIYGILQKLSANPELICEYGINAWNCGKKYHSKDTVQKNFYDELVKLSGV